MRGRSGSVGTTRVGQDIGHAGREPAGQRAQVQLSHRRTASARGFVLSWHEASRDRLWALCAATHAVEVVGYGRDLGPAIRFLSDEQVDVVLVDVDTAPGSPAWTISILRSLLPDGRIVAWGDDVTPFEEAFDAGVDAWIARSAEPGTLAAAVTGRYPAGPPR